MQVSEVKVHWTTGFGRRDVVTWMVLVAYPCVYVVWQAAADAETVALAIV